MFTRLRLERLRRGLRQIDVVAMCKGRVPQHRLSLFERGLPPQPGEARVLADVFGIDPEHLFPEFFRLANSQEKLPLPKEA